MIIEGKRKSKRKRVKLKKIGLPFLFLSLSLQFCFRFSFITAITLITSITLTGLSHATVKPSLRGLVNNSQWVIVATVNEVTVHSESLGVAQLKLKRVLKGDISSELQVLRLEYRNIGKVSIDFSGMKQNQKEYIFYIRGQIESSQNTVKLTDAWFGVEEADTSLEEKILKLISEDTGKKPTVDYIR